MSDSPSDKSSLLADKLDTVLPNADGNFTASVVVLKEAAAYLRAARSATLPPDTIALIQRLDALESEGNGWNPIQYPDRANDAERKFRMEIAAGWRSIRRFIPVPRSDGGTAKKPGCYCQGGTTQPYCEYCSPPSAAIDRKDHA